MPAVARLNDTCSGHGCWPPRSNDAASTDVFINGRGAHRQGDHWAPHTCPSIPETHDSVLAAGSASVFVNGRPLGRVGDAVACGSTIATGSDNVFAG
ncbi:PAAR domain-containing protein [Stutzerimonas kirkiae]|uniref:PAAR domain-containing protein n=1 Tax=Stutzerimonas kirkiae TaxID=2211392 RepID=UPI0010384E13|nr:PAAR domain-containing protein [Stutzerimonas kirkiae]TBV10268.1 PaaR repeat-containing protein [Stutzerimonas kirkiae]